MFFSVMQETLEEYKEKQGFFRRLFPLRSIKALESLSITDQSDPFKVVQCFVENPPKKSQASYQVYKTALANLDGLAIGLYRALRTLQEGRLLTPENRAAVIAHAKPNDLASALYTLQRAGILTPENRAAVIAHGNPEDLAYALRILQEGRHLTPENRATLIASANINPNALGSVARALYGLKQAGHLTPENIAAVIAHAPHNLADALSTLQRAEILTPENIAAVIAHATPNGLAAALRTLQEGRHLTPENRAAVTAHANPRGLVHSLHFLRNAGLLTLENLGSLSCETSNFLCTDRACQIVFDRIPGHLLTQVVFNQLIIHAQAANPEQEVRQYVDRLLGVNQHRAGGAIAGGAINAMQSTHVASVHKSVSESAKRLFDRYKSHLEGKGLEKNIAIIKDYVLTLSESPKDAAAKRCIKRITNPNFTFEDKASGLSILQALVLTYSAVSDKQCRMSSLENARAQFVEGLYEIQRGYNLSDTGVDTGGRDLSICTSGIFNKLIEKLEGIDPGVRIFHITPEIATLKLPVVVREVAVDYLSGLAKPQTVEELLRFTQLIDQIKQDECVDVIWDRIEPKITERLFDEFGSIDGYKKPHSETLPFSLTELVDNGRYLKLEDLSRFQQQISESPGYHRYCRQMLRCSASFFPTRKAAADYLSEHRHDSLEAQQKYDQQLGLVPRK
jgi:hypothetical protein